MAFIREAFSEDQKRQTWEKAQSAPGQDPNKVRKDICGAWIRWDDYGDRDSYYGWEIDHCLCQADGGGDDPENLQPLHWANNCAKGDGDVLRCAVEADGDRNVAGRDASEDIIIRFKKWHDRHF